jgi:DNA-binding MarR family transcriptional regulator
MSTINLTSLSRFVEALKVLRDATGNQELQMQTMLAFTFIATRHPNEVPIGELEKTLGFTQSTASRNVGYLARGAARNEEGYKLVEVFVDEFYQRRKLSKLTPKGVKVAERLSAALSF